MPSGSPSKRRKKTPATPSKTRTLDYFFAKQTAPQSPSRRAPHTAATTSLTEDPGHGLTDEEYARKLAEEWANEDSQATAASSAMASGNESGTSKRKRSSSPETSDRTPTVSGVHPIKPPAPEPSEAEIPKTKEVSVQADEEVRRVVDSIPFDSDPSSFDPDAYESLVNNWPEGNATYALLTRAFVLVDGTRSRIKIVDTLVNFIRTMIRLDPESLLPAVSSAPAFVDGLRA